MPHNERHEELIALLAIGSLGAEKEELTRHLDEGCRRCEGLLVDFRQSAGALAAAVSPRRPSRELRERILASVDPSRSVVGPARSPAPLAPWLLAAAAALLFVVVLLDDARVRREREEVQGRVAALQSRVETSEREAARRDLRARVLESEDVRILFLGGKDPQPRAQAKVFWSEKAKRGVLVAANLVPLPPDRQYQLWVFDEGKPVDAGVFDVDPAGRALFESKDLSAIAAAESFAVTVEPRGGVPQPTGPIVLIGSSAQG